MNRVLMVVITVVGGYALARQSAVKLPFRDPGESRLRLSWSARPERIETCRAATAQELSRELEHMRQRVVCEGRFATYALRVRIDSGQTTEQVVRGGGLRHDRLLHLLRDLTVTPGSHRLTIEFRRREEATQDTVASGTTPAAVTDTGLFAGRAERERTERTRRERAAIPAQLELDTSVVFMPGRVVVVRFDPEQRRLELMTEPGHVP